MFPINIIQIICTLIIWAIIIYMFTIIYIKEEKKLPLLKIYSVYFIGAFTFSIPLHLFDASVQLTIFPLGAWLMYMILKRRGSWQNYRKFIWLGFFSTYFYVIGFFIEHPLHMLFYKQDELTTYVDDLAEAQIYIVHPVGNEDVKLIQTTGEKLRSFQVQNIYSDEWYEEMFKNDIKQNKERFPYMLVGVTSKWGSGYKPTVYVERDGKGVLVTLPNKQYYFHSKQSILSEVKANE